ncbi:MAG: SOS response-associated peptidase family protein, partial [Acidobacteriaceae bacterium]
KEGRRQPAMMRWGLVPSWAKDEKSGFKMINAKAETQPYPSNNRPHPKPSPEFSGIFHCFVQRPSAFVYFGGGLLRR